MVWSARLGISQIPKDESYFHATHPRLEQDLRNIRGGTLLWQTEEEIAAGWDNEKDEPPSSDGWQSYHVFFLSPAGEEFHFEDETAGIEESEDPQPEAETTHPGEVWIGCAIGVCLAAPYAVINLCSYGRCDDRASQTRTGSPSRRRRSATR